MTCDTRDLLAVLKAELRFLESGGYGHSPETPQRPRFIFEDSPTCLNHRRRAHPSPCSECILMQFVPADCCDEEIPCRHIPLNNEGFTLDTYYRLGTHEEAEIAAASWLRRTIDHLQQDAGKRIDDLSATTAEGQTSAISGEPANV
jgi:hypothetical protein